MPATPKRGKEARHHARSTKSTSPTKKPARKTVAPPRGSPPPKSRAKKAPKSRGKKAAEARRRAREAEELREFRELQEQWERNRREEEEERRREEEERRREHQRQLLQQMEGDCDELREMIAKCEQTLPTIIDPDEYADSRSNLWQDMRELATLEARLARSRPPSPNGDSDADPSGDQAAPGEAQQETGGSALPAIAAEAPPEEDTYYFGQLTSRPPCWPADVPPVLTPFLDRLTTPRPVHRPEGMRWEAVSPLDPGQHVWLWVDAIDDAEFVRVSSPERESKRRRLNARYEEARQGRGSEKHASRGTIGRRI